MTAQTFTTLHSFTGGSDGENPLAGLILSGNILYGTAGAGGDSGAGTVFAFNTDGTGFSVLHAFTGRSDGGRQGGSLVLSGNTLYGTTFLGGNSGDILSSGAGTVFKVNTDGTGFTSLYSLAAASGTFPLVTNPDGANPSAGLILSGDTLYGTAYYGGPLSYGTVFALSIDGTGFTNLHNFTGGSNGANPNDLILSGTTLFGTAAGVISQYGAVFKVNTDGAGFMILHSFASSDGAFPLGGLVLLGNTLYGTTWGGGSSGRGTVFKVNTDGSGFTTLYSFTAGSGNYPFISNSDGAYPYAGLILLGNTLYGTAWRGGSSRWGTVFAVNTDGTGFTNLHSFTGDVLDGALPQAKLILSNNILYGTTYYGGGHSDGTVFSLSLGSVSPPQLTVTPSGAYVILTWPTNTAGVTLQSAAVITSTFTNIPGATSPYTNLITGGQQFFRLSQ